MSRAYIYLSVLFIFVCLCQISYSLDYSSLGITDYMSLPVHLRNGYTDTRPYGVLALKLEKTDEPIDPSLTGFVSIISRINNTFSWLYNKIIGNHHDNNRLDSYGDKSTNLFSSKIHNNHGNLNNNNNYDDNTHDILNDPYIIWFPISQHTYNPLKQLLSSLSSIDILVVGTTPFSIITMDRYSEISSGNVHVYNCDKIEPNIQEYYINKSKKDEQLHHSSITPLHAHYIRENKLKSDPLFPYQCTINVPLYSYYSPFSRGYIGIRTNGEDSTASRILSTLGSFFGSTTQHNTLETLFPSKYNNINDNTSNTSNNNNNTIYDPYNDIITHNINRVMTSSSSSQSHILLSYSTHTFTPINIIIICITCIIFIYCTILVKNAYFYVGLGALFGSLSILLLITYITYRITPYKKASFSIAVVLGYCTSIIDYIGFLLSKVWGSYPLFMLTAICIGALIGGIYAYKTTFTQSSHDVNTFLIRLVCIGVLYAFFTNFISFICTSIILLIKVLYFNTDNDNNNTYNNDSNNHDYSIPANIPVNMSQKGSTHIRPTLQSQHKLEQDMADNINRSYSALQTPHKSPFGSRRHSVGRHSHHDNNHTNDHTDDDDDGLEIPQYTSNISTGRRSSGSRFEPGQMSKPSTPQNRHSQGQLPLSSRSGGGVPTQRRPSLGRQHSSYRDDDNGDATEESQARSKYQNNNSSRASGPTTPTRILPRAQYISANSSLSGPRTHGSGGGGGSTAAATTVPPPGNRIPVARTSMGAKAGAPAQGKPRVHSGQAYLAQQHAEAERLAREEALQNQRGRYGGRSLSQRRAVDTDDDEDSGEYPYDGEYDHDDEDNDEDDSQDNIQQPQKRGPKQAGPTKITGGTTPSQRNVGRGAPTASQPPSGPTFTHTGYSSSARARPTDTTTTATINSSRNTPVSRRMTYHDDNNDDDDDDKQNRDDDDDNDGQPTHVPQRSTAQHKPNPFQQRRSAIYSKPSR